MVFSAGSEMFGHHCKHRRPVLCNLLNSILTSITLRCLYKISCTNANSVCRESYHEGTAINARKKMKSYFLLQ